MSDERRETMRHADSWWGREAAPRRALLAAAIMLIVLVATGALAFAHALGAAAVVMVAAWIGSSRRAPVGAMTPLPERRGPRLADPLVEAGIRGLAGSAVVAAPGARIPATAPRAP